MSTHEFSDTKDQTPADELTRRFASLNESISNAILDLHKLQYHIDRRGATDASAPAFDGISELLPNNVVRDVHRRIRTLDTQLGDFQTLSNSTLVCTDGAEERQEPLIAINGSDVHSPTNGISTGESENNTRRPWPWPLEEDEYRRYGRQLIMPEIGLEGQLRLKQSSVLIVGAGGLGCPAAQYLAAAGIGTLGLVDGDTVEVSNLHRQILHRTDTIGWSKVMSAIQSLRTINPLVTYREHLTHLDARNALEIFAQYDVVLDCTDHPTSRYLISDAAVLERKILVSAAALKMDGQLAVLNNPPAAPGEAYGGPCYRCVFPKPPPADSVVSCGEGGVLGPVVGVMGVLQALEAIKLIAAGQHLPVSSPPSTPSATAAPAAAAAAPAASNRHPPPSPSLLIFSATSPQPFRRVRLRGRKPSCAACSASATITAAALTSGSQDYVAFCGVAAPIDLLAPAERVSAVEFSVERARTGDANTMPLLVDVREQVQFALCSLAGAINVPYSRIAAWKPRQAGAEEHAEEEDAAALRAMLKGRRGVRVACRLGNDSQLAVRRFKELGMWDGEGDEEGEGRGLKHVDGGWRAWRRDVDASWPDY